VCEGEGALVLIDQHAAHERVAFERLRAAHARRGIERQRLLFPALVEISAGEEALAREHAALLDALGFDLEPFGPSTLAVKAVPESLGQADPAEVLRDVLAELGACAATDAIADRVDHVLATMACHQVVRAGAVLGAAEVNGLLSALDGVDFRGHCPHGRPVVVRMPVAELARRFGRT
jgi:DNA mismatch repair protein MutL